MPKKPGRGKVIKTRNIKAGKDKYMTCDVYQKPGPKGGKTVCSKPKKVKKK